MKIELNTWERRERKAVHKMHRVILRKITETLTDNLIGMELSQLQCPYYRDNSPAIIDYALY